MVNVNITIKVMPKTPEVSLRELKEKVKKEIENFGGVLGRVEEEPIGFGLVALLFTFNSPEEKSNLDPLEEAVKNVEGAQSCEVVSVTRAFG